jgi:hypothetical protein
MKLFVAMPYGPETGRLDPAVPATERTIEFDEVWKHVIRRAIPADWEAKRADELHRPGVIDRLYAEWLLKADIVLADLTFVNPNVYYELGIRQALSRRSTVLIAISRATSCTTGAPSASTSWRSTTTRLGRHRSSGAAQLRGVSFHARTLRRGSRALSGCARATARAGAVRAAAQWLDVTGMGVERGVRRTRRCACRSTLCRGTAGVRAGGEPDDAPPAAQRARRRAPGYGRSWSEPRGRRGNRPARLVEEGTVVGPDCERPAFQSPMIAIAPGRPEVRPGPPSRFHLRLSSGGQVALQRTTFAWLAKLRSPALANV